LGIHRIGRGILPAEPTQKERPIKIAISGAGNVGRALGTAWGISGHDVIVGVRNPDGPKYALLGSGSLRGQF
jgi:hypothetical protein